MPDDREKRGDHADVSRSRSLNRGDLGDSQPGQHSQRPLERVGCKDGIAPFFPEHAKSICRPDVAAACHPQIDPANPARDKPARKRADQVGQYGGGEEGNHD